jgi:broad specificity phosphatase PhoE
MLTLYLVRHGQTAYNAEGRVQGWLDIPLDEAGLRQAERVGQRFAARAIDAVYSSSLARAARTAQSIAAACNREAVLDDRLREYHMGDWTGLTGDEISAVTPGMRWDGPEVVIPGGESAHDMRERVSAWLDDLLRAHAAGRVVAVTHGGTLGALVSLMLGLPATRRHPFSFGNTSVTTVSFEHQRWRLRNLNDQCHLRDDGAHA